MLRLLDLFCGGGGAAHGYYQAGFTVIGVDMEDHEKSFREAKGDEFYRMSWEEGLNRLADDVDVIHASPPCQRYSRLTKAVRKENIAGHPDLIPLVREALRETGKPWIIENVGDAPLRDPVMLCGHSFMNPENGRLYEIYRHRYFESNLSLQEHVHLPHRKRASAAGHWEPDTFISVAGHFGPVALAREMMAIHWMKNAELAEAIPPYFTRYLGSQIMTQLKRTST